MESRGRIAMPLPASLPEQQKETLFLLCRGSWKSVSVVYKGLLII